MSFKIGHFKLHLCILVPALPLPRWVPVQQRQPQVQEGGGCDLRGDPGDQRCQHHPAD